MVHGFVVVSAQTVDVFGFDVLHFGMFETDHIISGSFVFFLEADTKVDVVVFELYQAS